MAQSNVHMTDTDGNIGSNIVVDNDAISGLVFDVPAAFWESGKGQAAADSLKDTVLELSSVKEAEEHGILPFDDTDTDGTKNLLYGVPYKHIKDFFTVNPSGVLYVSFADCSKNWDIIEVMQREANGKICQFGVWTEQSLWSHMSPEADKYSVNLVADLNSVAKKLADTYYAPAVIVLSANTAKVKTASGTDDKVLFSKIPTCKVDARYVSVLLGQSNDVSIRKMQGLSKNCTPVGSIGVAVGLLSIANVGLSIAWVGRFNIAGYYSGIEFGFGDATLESDKTIKNPTSYASLTSKQLDDLDDCGYMYIRSYTNYDGVYISKDQSCSSGDYCTIARNRTINKSRRGVRAALLPSVNSPIPVDPTSGNITAAKATDLANLISNVLTSMVNNTEISGIGTVSVPVAQNVLVTKTLKFSYTIVPLGCAEDIRVTEGLAVKS